MKTFGHIFHNCVRNFFGPGVLLFARFLRQMSYISLSKYSYSGVCGFPLLSMTNPSRSCQGYCLTPQVQYGVYSGW